MTIEERLATLSKEVTQTFHKDFLFLISPNLIQHFPARGWTDEQIEEELKKRLGTPLVFEPWGTHMIAYQKDTEELLIAVIP
ncbi:hypothetical protein IGI37_001908 [Enterococcus sp. AZ194]|uniref:hypothetical protein n=1 Tax=Enterococcus sp. AZ194 TaxID=2774629 RepID=UPI003F23BFF3